MVYKQLIIFLILSQFILSKERWQFSSKLGEQFTLNGETFKKFSNDVVINNDTQTIYSDYASQNNTTKNISIFGHVKMIDNENTLTCDSMFYWSDKDSIAAYGNVHLKQLNRGVTGNSIFIKYENKKIKSFQILENAYGYNEEFIQINKLNNPQKFVDEMTSKAMNGYLKDGLLEKLHLINMATTNYHMTQDSLLVGKNIASGDTIILHLSEKELSQIEVFNDARGEFFPEPENIEIDTNIVYSGKYINHILDDKKTIIMNDAHISYLDMNLESGKIIADWDTKKINAYEAFNQYPLVADGNNDPMMGEFLIYDLESKRGSIDKGKTVFDQKTFHGDQIIRDLSDNFLVYKSKYTSCDLDEPHFYLGSKYMKLIDNDRVVAKPLVLYISDFPAFYFPFAVFPNKKGYRHSGWIMPAFGVSEKAGTNFQKLGYFWAPNDYFDSRILLNFYDKKGFTVYLNSNYKKRYKYSGQIKSKIKRTMLKQENGEYFDVKYLFSDKVTQDWDLNLSHNQRFNPTTKLNIKYNYTTSSNFYQQSDIGQDLDTRLKQKINSSASFSKQWPNSKNSISIQVSEYRDLLKEQQTPNDDDTPELVPYKTRGLPNMRFSHATTQLFGNGDRWYNKLFWSYNSQLKRKEIINHVSFIKDSLDTDDDGLSDEFYQDWKDRDSIIVTQGIVHNLSFNAPFKLFSWLNVNQSIRLKESWVDRYYQKVLDDNGVFENYPEVTTINQFKRRLTGNYSMNLNTKIYGLFSFKVGKLRAIRHVITPNLRFTYRPNFSEPFLGKNLNYFQIDSEGNLFDYFENNSIVGRTSSGEQNNIALSISNLLQSKIQIDENKFRKNTLLNWTLSTSYDAAKDSINFSSISSSINTTIPGGLKLNIRSSYELYKRVLEQLEDNATQTSRRLIKINQFNDYPQLINMDISTNFDLNGVNSNNEKIWESLFALRYSKQKQFNYILNPITNYNEQTEIEPLERFWLDSKLKINLTKKWNINHRARFDLSENNIVSQSFHINRTLHCWDFSFRWWPTGWGKGFQLYINVRNPDFKDIKLESSSSNKKGY